MGNQYKTKRLDESGNLAPSIQYDTMIIVEALNKAIVQQIIPGVKRVETLFSSLTELLTALSEEAIETQIVRLEQ